MKRFRENEKNRNYATAALCAIALAFFFAGTAILVFLFGSRVYAVAVDKLSSNATSRTLLTYVTEKVRHFDAEGSVSVQQIDGISTLVLEDNDADEPYRIYMYAYQGNVCELTVTDETSWKPEAGDPILAVQDFEPEEVRPGLIHFHCVDSGGRSEDAYVHVRSAADESKGEEVPA
ncbi:MAG: DUF4860 domain-containing protein [Eubacterium sp.]|nr:DUF4860 domain-containing protein [Eubacterium sp.]